MELNTLTNNNMYSLIKTASYLEVILSDDLDKCEEAFEIIYKGDREMCKSKKDLILMEEQVKEQKLLLPKDWACYTDNNSFRVCKISDLPSNASFALIGTYLECMNEKFNRYDTVLN